MSRTQATYSADRKRAITLSHLRTSIGTSNGPTSAHIIFLAPEKFCGSYWDASETVARYDGLLKLLIWSQGS